MQRTLILEWWQILLLWATLSALGFFGIEVAGWIVYGDGGWVIW